MPGAEPRLAVKMNANFPGNPERFGLPTIQGVLVLFDGADGRPLAILDSMELTALRTAATSALAARYLARPDARTLPSAAAAGRGRCTRAPSAACCRIARVLLWDLDGRRAERLAAELAPELAGVAVRAGGGPRGGARRVRRLRHLHARARLLRPPRRTCGRGPSSPPSARTTTASRSWTRASSPRARSSSTPLPQCAELGELQHAVAAGLMTAEQVHAELAESSPARGRGARRPRRSRSSTRPARRSRTSRRRWRWRQRARAAGGRADGRPRWLESSQRLTATGGQPFLSASPCATGRASAASTSAAPPARSRSCTATWSSGGAGSPRTASSTPSTSACCCRGPRRSSSRSTSAGCSTASPAGSSPACSSSCRRSSSCSGCRGSTPRTARCRRSRRRSRGLSRSSWRSSLEAVLRIGRRALRGPCRTWRSPPRRSWRSACSACRSRSSCSPPPRSGCWLGDRRDGRRRGSRAGGTEPPALIRPAPMLAAGAASVPACLACGPRVLAWVSAARAAPRGDRSASAALHADVYLFFTWAAFVTFGGAYAVLAYVAQAAVEAFGWLTAAQAIDGLALAETTPGPLIMVLQFVGFMAGWNHPRRPAAGGERGRRRPAHHLGDLPARASSSSSSAPPTSSACATTAAGPRPSAASPPRSSA